MPSDPFDSICCKSRVETLIKQGSYRLEKCFNLKGFLEKSLKIQCALKGTGKSLKGLEKSLIYSIYCKT